MASTGSDCPAIAPNFTVSGKENERHNASNRSNNVKQPKAVDATNSSQSKALLSSSSSRSTTSSRTFSLMQQQSFTLQQYRQNTQQQDQSQHHQHRNHKHHNDTNTHEDSPNPSSYPCNHVGFTSSTATTNTSGSSSKRSPLAILDNTQTPQTRRYNANATNSNSDLPPRSISSSQRKCIGPSSGYSAAAAMPSPLVPLNITSSSGRTSSCTPNATTTTSFLDKAATSGGKLASVMPSLSLSPSSLSLRTPELSSDKSKDSVRSPERLGCTSDTGQKIIGQSQHEHHQKQKRVLLFGETMESLFCISEQHHGDEITDKFDVPPLSSTSSWSSSSDELVKLAQSIVDGERMDDPGAWRRVLELVLHQYERSSSQGLKGRSQNADADIVRLHRRATHWFPLDDESLSIGANGEQHHQTQSRTDDILQIWLRFARVQEMFGSAVEARRTYRFIENQKLLRRKAELYLCLADFEKRQQDSQMSEDPREVLRRGILARAHQLNDLEKELKAYEKNTPSRGTGNANTEVGRMEVASLSRVRFEISRGNDNLPRKRRQLLSRPNQSPKRQKIEKRLGDSPSSSGNDRTPMTKTRSSAHVTENKLEISGNESPKERRTAMFRKLSTDIDKSARKRPSLTSRLSCKGLSGKAKRVDAEQSFMSLADDEDDEESDDDRNDKATTTIGRIINPQQTANTSSESKSSTQRSKSQKTSMPRFNKSDLSYMWEWDPNERLKKKEEPANEDASSGSSGDSSNVSHDTTQNIQQDATEDDEKTKSHDKMAGSKSSSVPKRKTETDQSKPAGLPSENMPPRGSSSSKHGIADDDKKLASNSSKVRPAEEAKLNEKEKEIQSKKLALLDKVNYEFLPIVHESNILRINGAAYAKLGVIGKGGSSKVYRALSKKGPVVGIKRVKLDGMNKRAIEGYANEIALLKRLKGNPAIIQMFDSEVDMKRKVLYVVMELGEVDLNTVLKQRTISDTSRSLNLNFIRLTWQQMLSAVHCIHEERIIHSDLKPANFLFVRGGLKLIDFGIAKAITNENTTSVYREDQVGTVSYMSPEAITDTGSGEDGPRMKIGRASDVWSLGCILYEMVYGKTPFANLHLIQKLQAITNPRYVIEFPSGGDEAAVDAMHLCLRREPEKRPPIVGPGGLLNEHWFLHFNRKAVSSSSNAPGSSSS